MNRVISIFRRACPCRDCTHVRIEFALTDPFNQLLKTEQFPHNNIIKPVPTCNKSASDDFDKHGDKDLKR